MITENLMTIKSIREDEKYVAYQKQLFEEYNEKSRLEVKMARRLSDYDLRDHL